MEGSLNFHRTASGAQCVEAVNLRAADGGIIHFENIKRGLVWQAIFVDPDDDFLTRIDQRLTARGGFFDTHFRQASCQRLRHAAQRLDFLNVIPGTSEQIMGKRLDQVGTAPGINHLRDTGFMLQKQLGIAGNAR